MTIHTLASALVLSIAVTIATGCAVSRGQQTVGSYVDDAGITTKIKAQLLENKDVAGSSISVESLNGTVMLSGFAKSAKEKDTAERIARGVKGVKAVKNQIDVKP